MKAKLIKTEVNYLLEDDKGVIIASTSLKKEGLALSLKNCQAIERGYDLYELALEECQLWEHFGTAQGGYIKGFQKAVELMGDKKFSEDDVISMIEKSRETGLTAEYLILTKQQTEWEVTYNLEELDADGCLILKRI